MSNVLNSYPVFEDNQVLTSTQLNNFIDYLDQQNRLTRIKLIGVGVMCGLKPSYNSLTQRFSVSSGAGVTTEGYLLQIPDTTYDRYRDYKLPDGGGYEPFIDQGTATQFPMFEALPDTYMPEPGETIFPIDNTFMVDKIAVLFFELVDIDLQSCLGKSCDDMGITRTFNTRMLLIDKLVIDEMIVENNLGTDLNFSAKFMLPDYAITRALFDPTQLHSTNYFDFSKLYATSLSAAYKGLPTDPTKPGIVESIRQLYPIFQSVLETVYPAGDPLTVSVIPAGGKPEWNEVINGSFSPGAGPAYLGIQYMYDFVKDLILAYNEFRNVAFDLMSQCCVSSTLFPRHLFLGEAIPVDDCRPSKYRHEWLAAPVTGEQKIALARLISLHQRMVLMLKQFDTTIIHNPSQVSLPDIKVTPSREKMQPLSARAIPYYYNADAIDSVLNISLESVWDYELIRQCKSDASGQFPVQSWRNQTGDPFTQSPVTVQTPLFYDIDPYNFLRIEGHLRWKVDLAMARINTWKHFFDLPINVIKLRLAGQSTDAELLAKCNFQDLRSQYTSTRNEMDCFLGRIFDHFFETRIERGVPITTIRPFPDFVGKMFADAAVPGGSSSVVFLPATVSQSSAVDSVAGPAGTEREATPDGSRAEVAFAVYDPINPEVIQSSITTTLTQLMINMQNVIELLPTELDHFEYGNDITSTQNSFIKSYLAAMNNMINLKILVNKALDQITHSTRTKFPVEAYFMLSQWASEYFWFINEFVTDCKYRRLEAIFYELQYRLDFLKTNDPSVFSNFIEKHPGVDHKAGLAPGSTFILVYPGASLTTVPRNVAVATDVQVSIAGFQAEVAVLDSLPFKTPEDERRINTVRAKLCDLYAEQFQSMTDDGGLVKPIPVSAIAIPKPIYRINIAPDDVIADFTLPYLATCECDCDAIPAPTAADLAIPALNIPALYEFNPGDYAFVNDSNSSTTGCYNSGEAMPSLLINVAPLQSVSGSLILKVRTNAATGSLGTDLITAKGGQVSVENADGKVGLTQRFRYTPSRTFLGIDEFYYVFEVYNQAGSILLRSNMAKVTVTVVPRCNAVVVSATAVDSPNTPLFTE
ncbi:MAG: Uncharacterized protein FD123_2562 [Bacteroidetes bacterium]|nr:MAG: Uncharacterized protein FD123_2562 [Bacteroidota bacterium]